MDRCHSAAWESGSITDESATLLWLNPPYDDDRHGEEKRLELAFLKRAPVPGIYRAVQTLLDLSETWENTTQGEHRDPVHVMIQEVGDDMAAKCMLWVKARPDYEPLFSILHGASGICARNCGGCLVDDRLVIGLPLTGVSL